MSIQEIKAALTIERVLGYYGLKANSRGMLNCPFHKDGKASMKVYSETNTVYCFAGGCIGSVDAIDFILQMDKSNKHQALVKAKQLLGKTTPPIMTPKMSTSKSKAATKNNLAEEFKAYQATLKKHTESKAYCDSRCLEWQQLAIGYKSRRAADKWGRGCLIFPLKNVQGQIVSLYGRSIKGNSHYYSAGRSGLYPSYPDANTKRLLLTESIIDAASLLQQKAITADHFILAMYGTNGLTAEHITAIKSLSNLEEIIFFLDGDTAGRAAVKEYTTQLKKLVPKVRLMNITALEEEDVNSILQAHDPSILVDMVANRKVIKQTNNTASIATPIIPPSTLDTSNPDYLTYVHKGIRYTLMGGLALNEMDRMRVTLKIHAEPLVNPLYSLRHSLDLYNDDHLQKFCRKAAERLELSSSLVLSGLCELVHALETYRMETQQRVEPTLNKRVLTNDRAKKAKAWLKKSRLLKRTNEAIAATGIVGEENNRLLVYLCFTSRLTQHPLHLITLGPSGSGKTYLQEKLADLIPEEEVLQFTTSTENAMYYFENGDLQNKLVLCEDLDGAEGVLYTLRELMSKDMISKIVTRKDSKGNMKTERILVKGPIVLAATTTRDRLYEDNANRALLISPDFSASQADRIQDYQRKLSAGTVNKTLENKWKEFFKDVQSVLKPIEVRNPYAEQLRIPKTCFKPLRTNAHYLHFIEVVTFYHQYQREIKACPISKTPYIETSIEDIKAANELITDILMAKTDELSIGCRSFLDRLQEHLKKETGNSFYSAQIRTAFRLNPNTLKYYLRELVKYGQVKITGGNRYGRGYEYELINMDGREVMRQNIENILSQTLKKLVKSTG